MQTFFYLPPQHVPSAERQRAWAEGAPRILEASGKKATVEAWVWQTWGALRRAGCVTEVVTDIPAKGIVITMASLLPPDFCAPQGLFVADIVADALPHPGAHLHLVQNAAHSKRLRCSVYVPHWPQPGLMPRDARRGHTFERVCFFGDPANLDSTLRTKAWAESLRTRTGAVFELRSAERWHDYNDVDAVVAARDFSGRPQLRKPATKLHNAWLAGVPFVGSNESALGSGGHSGRTYLSAGSPTGMLGRLEELSRNVEMRKTLVRNGWQQARELTNERMTARWLDLLKMDIPAAARRRESAGRITRGFENILNRASCAADRLFTH